MEIIQIIVPTRNESDNIVTLVERISAAFKQTTIMYSIIIVDYKSHDGTKEKVEHLKKNYPVKFYQQKTNGKAQAILEGVSYANSEYVIMIDADLQYPPEAIPEMVQKVPEFQVVVARRTTNNEKVVRKVLSKIHAYLFGQLLFGLDCDIQSGLKLFPKELVAHLDTTAITAWTLDLSLLYTAQQLGYRIGEVPITFAERRAGESKVNIFRSVYEHTYTALKIKFFSKKIV